MKVLFTHSYFLEFDVKQKKQSKPYPPLATLYAASYLRNNGFEVNLWDCNFASDPNQIKGFLEKEKPDLFVIYDDSFNYLTKMCLTNMREAAFEMIKIAKEHNIHVAISSSDSTDHYDEYLNHGADQVILGEGEETLLELAKLLKAGRECDPSLLGVAWNNNGINSRNASRSILKDLDSLPFPAWDLIHIADYQSAWRQHGYFSINVATTRGCPFKCNWCAKPIYGNRYNSHSPQYVSNLISYMQELFDFEHIWFCDDIFGLKPGWVQEFQQKTETKDLKLRYKIQSRADLLVKENTVEALALSGCEEVWIGAESGSQKVLDAMDKGIDIRQIEQSTRLMKKFGIKPCFFLQFGYPEEKWKDIKLTIQMLKKLQPADIGVSVSYPLPGTKFYNRVKEQLENKANWTDSDELLLMYKGTFSPSFYKTLHRYVHRIFRSDEVLHNLKRSQLSLSSRLQFGLRFLYHEIMEILGHIKLNFLLLKN